MIVTQPASAGKRSFASVQQPLRSPISFPTTFDTMHLERHLSIDSCVIWANVHGAAASTSHGPLLLRVFHAQVSRPIAVATFRGVLRCPALVCSGEWCTDCVSVSTLFRAARGMPYVDLASSPRLSSAITLLWRCDMFAAHLVS